MMKIKTRISMLLIAFLAIGCSKKDDDTPVIVESIEKQMISFVFNTAENTSLSGTVTASINESGKTISATIPAGTDATNLTPTITISEKASVSPLGAQDFSNAVSYTVTAEDGSTATYRASVVVTEQENKAPLAFDLVTVPDGAVDVDVLPILSWNASTDPDGDTVLYDVYLSLGESASILYESNITENSLEITDRLSIADTYSWKVIAKDPDGLTAESSINSFTVRSAEFNTTPENDNAGFSKRDFNESIVFDNTIWVIGGRDADNKSINNVWSSKDGVDWQEASSSNPFPERQGHTTVVFDNKVWAIGGIGADGKRKNDVWVSKDGGNWDEVVKNAPFTARVGHTSVVFDNKIWVFGGIDENAETKSDVWSSEDGLTWKEVAKTSVFNARRFHNSIVFDGAMYLIGGEDENGSVKNDVWVSKDGFTWNEVTKEASFSKRSFFSSVVYDNKIWVIGGNTRGRGKTNDVWFSIDGKNWTETTSEAPFSSRSAHTSVVYDNKVWVIAGSNINSDKLNDVWTFE